MQNENENEKKMDRAINNNNNKMYMKTGKNRKSHYQWTHWCSDMVRYFFSLVLYHCILFFVNITEILKYFTTSLIAYWYENKNHFFCCFCVQFARVKCLKKYFPSEYGLKKNDEKNGDRLSFLFCGSDIQYLIWPYFFACHFMIYHYYFVVVWFSDKLASFCRQTKKLSVQGVIVDLGIFFY